MARALDASQITAADELRGLLTESEKQMTSVRGQRGAALDLLHNLDRINTLWPALEAAGVDLRPEAGRWETLQAHVDARAGAILNELAAVGGLAALRDRVLAGRVTVQSAPSESAVIAGPGNGSEAQSGDGGRPAGDAPSAAAASEVLPWWWYLDRRLRERRRRQLIRSVSIALAVVVVASLGLAVFRRLFPVDPKVAASARHISAGQQGIINNRNYAAALTEFRAATDLTPADADAWLWLGAVQQKLGQDPTEAFANAHRLSGDELSYLLGRGPVYAQLESYAEARADLNAALKIDAQNPQAWYYLAGVDEAQGRLPAAAADLDKASTYADARQNSELVAMARVRLGYLLQRMQASSLNENTPTPSGN